MVLLLGLTTFNVFSSQNKQTLNSIVDQVVSDIKQQQLKAMVGDSEGRTAADVYGIHFDANQYVLFHGTTYTSGNTTNFAIPLESNVSFSNVLFSNSNLIFTQGNGKVSGFVQGSNSFKIVNSSNNGQKTITINQYGVITQIQ
jgi:hypothetical protein